MKHPVSGEIKELSEAEFFALFDASMHEALRASTKLSGTTALVVFENLNLGTPLGGSLTAMAVGPGRTYDLPAMEDAGCRLGQVPSRFQYPVAVWRITK